MARNNSELSAKLAASGARMTPLAFDQTMADLFQVNKARLIQFAGDETTARKYMAALMYSASRNPKLIECDPMSLLDSLMQAAQLKLWPGATQECAIVPYKGKATFQPMVRGLITLAYRAGIAKSIQAEIVYTGDEFDYELGLYKRLYHKPFLGADEDRGEPWAVYCIVSTGTESILKVKSMAWVNSIRAKSVAAKFEGSPWDTSFDEMAIKSIVKYTLKSLPQSPELAAAIEADNALERPELVKREVVPLKKFEAKVKEAPAAEVDASQG